MNVKTTHLSSGTRVLHRKQRQRKRWVPRRSCLKDASVITYDVTNIRTCDDGAAALSNGFSRLSACQPNCCFCAHVEVFAFLPENLTSLFSASPENYDPHEQFAYCAENRLLTKVPDKTSRPIHSVFRGAHSIVASQRVEQAHVFLEIVYVLHIWSGSFLKHVSLLYPLWCYYTMNTPRHWMNGRWDRNGQHLLAINQGLLQNVWH